MLLRFLSKPIYNGKSGCYGIVRRWDAKRRKKKKKQENRDEILDTGLEICHFVRFVRQHTAGCRFLILVVVVGAWLREKSLDNL